MPNCLVIGSAAADVIIRIPHLPSTGEDIHIISQEMSLGGCAWNVFHTIRLFQIPAVLFSPIGTGVYGDFIRSELAARNVSVPIPSPEEKNGCCYCFVEDSGERTFLSHRGAEYRFREEWFQLLPKNCRDYTYVCGLEIEESTGETILRYLEAAPGLQIFFAPGPRICQIEQDKLNRLFALRPVLHLNETEALSYTGKETVEQAAQTLHTLTGNIVIVTLGENGAYYNEGTSCGYVPPVQTDTVTDTIGAGDAHIGAVMACLAMGLSLKESIRTANRVSAAVVGTRGACLSKEAFDALCVPAPQSLPIP
ncbi:carbohydrate kinase family protein [Qiania dongpingensis]|uniref:Carbohydrate kinase family protein n=1 Tax=Qiania dongpingensis TaxID=2763669 RepID=A0A7G9G4X6_9FIRM|nr:PfkB family carbohydrate kinase [Qiania dongpingensis]QNM05858.1 carbohydrate kinase family protein [Qiania dongpingensis]